MQTQNVYEFPSKKGVAPEDMIDVPEVLNAVWSLWHAGDINTPAYAIATQALYHIACNESKKTGFIETTWAELSRCYVRYEDRVLATPPRLESIDLLAGTLAPLHYSAGILSSVDKRFFNANGNAIMHFSADHPTRRKADRIEPHTPIYFRLDKLSREEYRARIQALLDASVEGHVAVELRKS